MAGIIDFIQQQITPETVNRISTEIGEDPAKTRQAIDAAVPSLAGSVSGAGDPGPGGLGGLLGGVLGGSGAGGEGILDSILGGSRSRVENDVAQSSGIAPQKVMRILTMLAPIVIAAYSRQKQGGAPQAEPGTATQPGTSTQGGGGLLGDIIDRVT